MPVPFRPFIQQICLPLHPVICLFPHSWTKVPKPSITMYNFGSPRVGNKHFVAEYNQKVPDSWRLANR